jgi:CIC family chloride channel protein
LLYALLGLLAALLAVGFTRLLYLSEDVWDKLRFPEALKPVLGGVFLGMLGILTPQIDGFPRIFGVGYDTITQALFGELALQLTVALLVAKVLATIITLGSGGSGGIFAPSLFMGAMLGQAFGQVVHAVFPTITAPVGAYALVGMAAVFSGAAHAPVTAILILFEMTGDYHIILPLMLTTVTSTLVSRLISRESIYTLKLTRRGVHLSQGQDIDVMQSISVRDAMTTDVDTVPLTMSLDDLASEFARSHHHGFPVVDSMGELAGVVSIQDLERAKAAGPIDGRTVADIATREGVLVAYPYEPMWKALRRLCRRDVGRLPVVEEEGSRRLVGAVRRSDIIRAYDQAIAARAHHQHQVDVLRLGHVDGARFLQLRIPSSSSAVGQRIGELELPEECLIISVRRGRKLHMAHGYTTLESGDRVTVLAGSDCAPEVHQILTGESTGRAQPS